MKWCTHGNKTGAHDGGDLVGRWEIALGRGDDGCNEVMGTDLEGALRQNGCRPLDVAQTS